MPLVFVSNPDPLVAKITSELLSLLRSMDSNNVTTNDFQQIRKVSAGFMDDIQDAIHSKYDHLTELSDLKEILDSLMNLDTVLRQLLPGRIKWLIRELKEVEDQNNAEVVRFVKDGDPADTGIAISYADLGSE